MKADRWHRIEAIFHSTVDLDAAERSAVLEAECSGDEELRSAVETLLGSDAASSEILDAAEDPLGLEQVDLLIGQQLGAYRLTRRIAVGGMGVVYAAERTDGLFDREVAVKLLRVDTGTEEMIRRFDLERRTLAKLDHPNIARLYDGGTSDQGRPYLVMELIHGLPIDRFCDERQLSITERLKLLVDICRAVHFAHQHLVVHRDLKPANVLVDEEGVPRLLDFGIARMVEDQDGVAPERTRTQARILTPEYASPEQLSGAEVTTATDVYSLGVILYGLLTGKKPFRSESRSPIAWQLLVIQGTPTRPSSAVLRRPTETGAFGQAELAAGEFAQLCGTTAARLRNRLTGDLDRIVLMALRKEPERRYASAQELAEDIERHLAGMPVLAREDSVLYRVSKFARRNRIAVAAAALALIALMLALMVGFVSARRGERLAREESHHTQIESDSFQIMSSFLTDTFLRSGSFNAQERKRAITSVERQAERVRRQHADDVHLRANLLDGLGRVCASLDDFEHAEGLLREALELRLTEFGPESIEVALSLGNLGRLEYRRGDFGAAEESLRRALVLHRATPPGTHTDIALAANDLAAVLRNRGQAQEAEALHREALALRRLGGEDTLPVAESLNNLAGILLDRGDSAGARELLSEALAIRLHFLGPEHPLCAQMSSNLAVAVSRLGDFDEARRLLEQAETGYRALFDEGAEDLARVLSNRASLDYQSGELEAAERRLEEAAAILLGRLGPDDLKVASVLNVSAMVQHGLGRETRARELYEEVLRIRRATLDGTNPKLGRTLQEYGVFLTEIGALDEAEPVLREALAILSATTPDQALLARAELSLGNCLLRTQRLEEAESLLLTGLERLEAAPGAGASELADARGYFEALQAARSVRDG